MNGRRFEGKRTNYMTQSAVLDGIKMAYKSGIS